MGEPFRNGDKVSVKFEGVVCKPGVFLRPGMNPSRDQDSAGWLEIAANGVHHILWYFPGTAAITVEKSKRQWDNLGVETGDIWRVNDQEFIAVQDLDGSVFMRRVTNSTIYLPRYELEGFGEFDPILIRRRYWLRDEAEAVNLPS